MDYRGYIILLAGVGYLGYNLAYNYIGNGENVLIISRKKSIIRRWTLFQRLRRLGARFYIDDELTPNTVLNAINRFGRPRLIYYLAGINRGSTDEMKYVHGRLSFHIASKIYRENLFRGRYIHISAYNPGIVLSGYIESKIYGEKLLERLTRNGYSITILRPGLLVGKYPYHPEWIQMYQLAKRGITIETNIVTGYTPIKDIYEFVEYLEEKDINKDIPINLTFFYRDIGIITRVFSKELGFEDPLTIRINSPKRLWKILPYHGSLGFLRGFIYPHKPPRPSEVYRIGYRVKSNLIKELIDSLNDLRKMEIQTGALFTQR